VVSSIFGLLPTYYNPLTLTFVLTTNHLHAYAQVIATYYLPRRPTYKTNPLHDMFVESPIILPTYRTYPLQGQLLTRYYPIYTPMRLILYRIGYQGKTEWQFSTREGSIFNRPFRDLRHVSWDYQGWWQAAKNCRMIER
jgi:hypothetical protein